MSKDVLKFLMPNISQTSV